jgi:hypothetical protein
MNAKLAIQGAKRFGVDLHLDVDDELVFTSRHKHAGGILRDIRPRKEEIVSFLAEERRDYHFILDSLSTLTRDEYEKLAAMVEGEIEYLRDSLDKITTAASALMPLMESDDATFANAAATFLEKHKRHNPLRPAFSHDIEWVVALRHAWGLGLNQPRVPEKVGEP